MILDGQHIAKTLLVPCCIKWGIEDIINSTQY